MLLIQGGIAKKVLVSRIGSNRQEYWSFSVAGVKSGDGTLAAPASLALSDALVILFQPLLLGISEIGRCWEAHPTTSLVASPYPETAITTGRIIEVIVRAAIANQSRGHSGHGKHFLLLL